MVVGESRTGEVTKVNGVCALCDKEAKLQLSHILPKFVIKYVKESAPSAIRSNQSPNRRIQDGPKEYLLCWDCEQLFARWEKLFYENLFLPLHSPTPVTSPLYYRQWALKFAVSVSWRVLLSRSRRGLTHFSAQQQASAQQALDLWRRFLLGQERHPGRYEQHLLPLDVIESHTKTGISPFLNRYNLRVVQTDVIALENMVFTCSKLCRVIIFGFIDVDSPLVWQGTKLHVNKGEIIPRRYVIPYQIDEYMNEMADKVKDFFASMSPQQQRKVDEAIRENLDELVDSEIFRAMNYDVAHSGDAAFKNSEAGSDDSERP